MTKRKLKVSERHNNKLSGLNKNVQIKNRRELYENDYAHLLNKEEAEWLSNFNKEYINADFTHPGKRIHKKKLIKKKLKTKPNKIKIIDVFKKDCEDRNNARNRDSFTITKANKYLKDEQNVTTALEINRSTNNHDVEDLLIEMIDLKNKKDLF